MFLPMGKRRFIFLFESSMLGKQSEKSIVPYIPAVNGLKNVGTSGSKCFMLTMSLRNTGIMFYWLFEKEKSEIFLTQS